MAINTKASKQIPSIIQSFNGWVFFLSSDYLTVAKSNIGYTYQGSDCLNLIWLALGGVSQPYEDTNTSLMSDEEVDKLPLEEQPYYYGFKILRLDAPEKALQDSLYHLHRICSLLLQLEKAISHIRISELNNLLNIPQGKEPYWWAIWLQQLRQDEDFDNGSIPLSTAEYLLSPPWYDSSICNHNPEV